MSSTRGAQGATGPATQRGEDVWGAALKSTALPQTSSGFGLNGFINNIKNAPLWPGSEHHFYDPSVTHLLLTLDSGSRARLTDSHPSGRMRHLAVSRDTSDSPGGSASPADCPSEQPPLGGPHVGPSHLARQSSSSQGSINGYEIKGSFVRDKGSCSPVLSRTMLPETTKAFVCGAPNQCWSGRAGLAPRRAPLPQGPIAGQPM